MAEQTSVNQKAVRLNLFMIGAYSSGKTSLLNRYARGTFNEAVQATVSADFVQVEYVAKDRTKIHVKLWDTSGSERFVKLLP